MTLKNELRFVCFHINDAMLLTLALSDSLTW